MIKLINVTLPSKKELMPAIENVLYSGVINEGEKVKEFETEFGKLVGVDNAIALNSGTAALHIALIMAGVGFGDEVISTALTAEPTNTAIRSTGATLRYYDLNPIKGNINVDSLIDRITPKTKAIVVVHYGGYVQNVRSLKKAVSGKGISIIEDCAHALLAAVDGKVVGTEGDFGCFSFQAIKQMTSVEGGLLVCKETKHIATAREIRWFGISKEKPRSEANIIRQGYKYNFNNVNAVIALQQLKTIKHNVDHNRKIAAKYVSVIRESRNIKTVIEEEGEKNAFWLFILKCADSELAIKFFHDHGVEASKIHKLNNYHDYLASGDIIEGAEKFYSEMLHIPIGPWVSIQEANYICEVIRDLDNELER